MEKTKRLIMSLYCYSWSPPVFVRILNSVKLKRQCKRKWRRRLIKREIRSLWPKSHGSWSAPCLGCFHIFHRLPCSGIQLEEPGWVKKDLPYCNCRTSAPFLFSSSKVSWIGHQLKAEQKDLTECNSSSLPLLALTCEDIFGANYDGAGKLIGTA